MKALARDVDLCLPLFRFEHEFLEARGVSSAWRGHPLADEFVSVAPAPPLWMRAACASSRSGDRRFADCFRRQHTIASRLRAEGFSPVFSVAPGLSDD